MSIFFICLLLVLGIILLLAEFLIIPGITIAGVAGTLIIIGGIVSGYYYHSILVGNYIFIGTIVVLLASFIWALNAKSWRRFGLKAEIDGKVGGFETGKIATGDEGISISKLSPIGKATFNETTFEVSSEGGYINQNSEITVSRIVGNKIYVVTKN